MSPGRRELLRALQITTEIEVALRCHVTQSAVSRWATGRTKPSIRHRRALAEHLWITAEWDDPILRKP